MELKRKTLSEEKTETDGVAEDVSRDRKGEEPQRSLAAEDETVPGDGSATAGTDDDEPVNKGGSGMWGRPLPKFAKILLFGFSAFLLLTAAGVLFLMFGPRIHLFAGASPKLEPVTSIKRPIPLPDYREMLDFLLVYDVDGQKMMTALRMEIGYQNPTRHENFREQTVAFRDVVYSFLTQQNMARNTVKSWHTVLEKDLLDCLRAKLPQSCPDTISLTQVENL